MRWCCLHVSYTLRKSAGKTYAVPTRALESKKPGHLDWAKCLILLARPARVERATFGFGGQKFICFCVLIVVDEIDKNILKTVN